jgi:hypothetical protein
MTLRAKIRSIDLILLPWIQGESARAALLVAEYLATLYSVDM